VTADQAGGLVETQARVVAVGPGFAWVVPARRSACGGCSSSGACATPILGSLAGGGSGSGASRIQIDDPLGLGVGEGVVIGIPDAVLNRAAVLAYLLPPAALVLGAGSAGALGAGDLGSAVAGFLGLALGLGLTRLLTGGTAGRGSYRTVLIRRRQVAAAPGVAFNFHQTHRGTAS
jgi:sigma-E factor negative regulatory protein RseC